MVFFAGCVFAQCAGIVYTCVHMETQNSQTVQKIKTTPRDVFTQLLAVATMYASAVSLIALLFQYVNRLLPDSLAWGDYGISQAIRVSLSVLVIVFPVFLWVTRFFERDMRAVPEKRYLAIRRWLLHFTLFVAAITIIVDLVTLVYNFLGGELTARFLFKMLAVLFVAVLVFAYYLMDLKREGADMPLRMRTFARAAIIAVCGILVGGFFIVGSHKQERLRRFDEERVNSLNVLQGEVISYWQQKNDLPENLEALKNDITGFIPPQDPETFMAYEYRRVGNLSFELCATFALATPPQNPKSPKAVDAYPYRGPYQQNWDHAEGRMCFMRTIDPTFYKPQGVPPVPIR